jgi:hypothetical protein
VRARLGWVRRGAPPFCFFGLGRGLVRLELGRDVGRLGGGIDCELAFEREWEVEVAS